MKPLYSKIDFDNAKSKDKLPCECYECKSIFHVFKANIQQEQKYKRGRVRYCSQKCHIQSNHYTKQKVSCAQCGKEIKKQINELKRSKSGNHFCSKSCSVTYNNLHKKHGTRRSKLEIWLEEQLTILYPDLNIDYNGKEAIGSELDIYIPSMKLAFELNGIFHYEPIYGQDKLDKIQENDQNKFQACIDKKISLCIIDSSSLKYFKPNRAQKYLDIITEIINKSKN